MDRNDAGESYPYRNDGSIFKNNEALLPPQSYGYYTKYVVPNDMLSDVGPQRIVTGKKEKRIIYQIIIKRLFRLEGILTNVD